MKAMQSNAMRTLVPPLGLQPATWSSKLRHMTAKEGGHTGIVCALTMCRGYLASAGVDMTIKVGRGAQRPPVSTTPVVLDTP